jgi:hypothetical protein
LYRFLGKKRTDKKIYIGFKPTVDLPKLFIESSAEERVKADEGILNSLLRIAEGYVETQRTAVKTRVTQSVEAFLNNAAMTGVDTDVETVLGGQLADVWKKATSDVGRIVGSEATKARNMGSLDGIVRVNAASGVEDPIVYFVVVRDDVTCEECRRLHLMPDGITPRLWYLSELSHKYHVKGEDVPSVSGGHPNCRCTMVTMLKGYGFDKSGMVTFIDFEHDEMAKQRGVYKNEPVSEELEEVKKIEDIEEAPEVENVKVMAADLAPLLDPNTGRLAVGTNDDFKQFSKSVGDGVFVAFRGSKTDLDKESLYRLVPDAVQGTAPNARIFARGKTFKIFVANQTVADDVVAAIQSAVLEGEE